MTGVFGLSHQVERNRSVPSPGVIPLFGWVEEREPTRSRERHIPSICEMCWYLRFEGTTRNRSCTSPLPSIHSPQRPNPHLYFSAAARLSPHADLPPALATPMAPPLPPRRRTRIGAAGKQVWRLVPVRWAGRWSPATATAKEAMTQRGLPLPGVLHHA